jgi:hypothetical protein
VILMVSYKLRDLLCREFAGPICGLCKHHTLLEVANLIAVVGGDTTAHGVRQRTRCHNCGVKGNNTYQIVTIFAPRHQIPRNASVASVLLLTLSGHMFTR